MAQSVKPESRVGEVKTLTLCVWYERIKENRMNEFYE